MAEYLKSKPLINLSDAIGINDKFLFIREIFNGNKESYSRAIAQLDHTGSLPEARKLIMGYKGDEEENEAVKQLLDIIKRKFPGHE
jgi:muramoyltetrapeptide carboxypeptidase LdcA involved in peptidoglycan recycling